MINKMNKQTKQEQNKISSFRVFFCKNKHFYSQYFYIFVSIEIQVNIWLYKYKISKSIF